MVGDVKLMAYVNTGFKRIIKYVLLPIVIFFTLLLLSCGNEKQKLSAPTDIAVGDDGFLTWSKVDNAHAYTVDINGEQYETAENRLDIFELTHNVDKVYNIKISAFGNWDKFDESDWSEITEYKISDLYLKGLGFALINNDAEIEVSVISASLMTNKIVIPQSIGNLPVTSVAQNAFKNCEKLTSAYIPDTVNNIGFNAFANCSALTRIRLPKNITKIESGMFESCVNLLSVVVPSSVIEISTSAFARCKKLSAVDLSADLTHIGNSAFSGCESLREVIFPNNVEVIKLGAFSGCKSLKSIHIPKFTRYIEVRAFYGEYIDSITVEDGNDVYAGDGNCLIRKADKFLLAGCNSSVIPNYVESIAQSAFYNCLIKSVNLPNTLRSVGRIAFYGCAELKELHIPQSLTEIYEDTFSGCVGIERITVAQNNAVYCGEGNCIIRKADNTVVYGCKNSVIPDYIETIGTVSFRYCIYLNNIVIPNSVKTIEVSAFRDCISLKKISLPNSVAKIETGAFHGAGLYSVTLPQSAGAIERQAFMGITAYVPFENWQDGWQTQIFNGTWTGAAFHQSSLVYGCELREDGGAPWVYSIKNNIKGVSPYNGGEKRVQDLCDNPRIPHRDGYVFKGWTSVEGGTTAEYAPYTLDNGEVAALSAAQRANIPQDATLYAVWAEDK